MPQALRAQVGLVVVAPQLPVHELQEGRIGVVPKPGFLLTLSGGAPAAYCSA